MMWLWGLTILLMVVVMVLVWLQVKNQRQDLSDLSENHQLKQQVAHLEDHLKKTLEIMQDLAKKMHVQQEALDPEHATLVRYELADIGGQLFLAFSHNSGPIRRITDDLYVIQQRIKPAILPRLYRLLPLFIALQLR